MASLKAEMNSTLEIESPKKFGLREVLILNALGLILSFIIGACGVAVLTIFISASFTFEQIVIAAVLVFFIAAGFWMFVLPSVLGNPYVRRIVRKSLDEEPPETTSYVSQVSFSPRLHDGFRGFMEDADDIGRLEITSEAVTFLGDQVRIVLPLISIKEVSHSSSGIRGLWIAGRRIRITTTAFEDFTSLEFMERQSNTVVSSRRISKEIIRELEHGIQSDDAQDT